MEVDLLFIENRELLELDSLSFSLSLSASSAKVQMVLQRV
jgi:hypothetical protein